MRTRRNLVLNKKPSKGIYTPLLFNIAANVQLTHNQMEGRDYLVVPCVMMTEGVHAGSQGPLLYKAEELAANVQVWNMKPVVVYHPEKHGEGVSACDPEIATEYKVGVLMNTRFEDGKLKTECWLEEDRVREVDDRVLNALQSGQMMEVSTGVFVDTIAEEGEWNGETYDGMAVNHRPDHLAILPDQLGACSIADGAGLLRNAAEEDKTPEGLMAQNFLAVVNEMSHDEIWRALNDKIRSNKEDSDMWVVDVYDDWFIYHDGPETYHQRYNMEGDEVMLDGLPQPAEKVTYYTLSDGTLVGNASEQAPVHNHRNSKGEIMDPEEMIALLISNEQSPWTEEDREILKGMSEDKLAAHVEANKPAEEPEKKEPEVKAPETKPVENNDEELTVDQYIEQAPAEMRDALRSGLTAHQEQKDALIAKIVANKRNVFGKDILNTKSLDELKGLAALAEEPTTTAPAPHYGGQAPVDNSATSGKVDEEPLVMPTMNFGADD